MLRSLKAAEVVAPTARVFKGRLLLEHVRFLPLQLRTP